MLAIYTLFIVFCIPKISKLSHIVIVLVFLEKSYSKIYYFYFKGNRFNPNEIKNPSY